MQAPATPRSAFIDSLARTTLIISLVAIPISLLMLLTSSASNVDVREALAHGGFDITLPDSVVFVVKHLKTISLLLFAFSIFSAICSRAMLRRRNWARIAFIAMLALNIVANIVGVIYSFFSPAMRLSAKGLPAEAQAQIEWTLQIAMAVNAILIIGLSVAMAWLMKRLMSDVIRREFGE
jgi:formate hydrogenlyase subunit 3/multisubunit Na+/H+ antiporter MnhD subunit